jgi:hypothetical protein
MNKACSNVGVCHARRQRWDVALSKTIVSNVNNAAITAQKHCMSTACRNLGVCHPLIQRWDIALSTSIVSDGNNAAITPQKQRMT